MLGVSGVALPRGCWLAFSFGDERRAFVVSLDLVARSASAGWRDGGRGAAGVRA